MFDSVLGKKKELQCDWNLKLMASIQGNSIYLTMAPD